MPSVRYFIIALAVVLSCAVLCVEQSAAAPAVDLVIDTDTGVDDATALVWLLSQTDYPLNIHGIGTVVGNTSSYSAANNVLTILDATHRRGIPVAVGAAKPLSQPLSPGPLLGLRTPALLHGSDGLWGIGLQHPHQRQDFDRRDAPALYRDLGFEHPGATLLALGPLTNIAMAFSRYPDAMRQYARIVIGASAKYGGNRTPSAEYSLWQDPEALSVVLSSRLGPEIVDCLHFLEDDVARDVAHASLGEGEIDRMIESDSTALGPLAQAGASALEAYRAFFDDCLTFSMVRGQRLRA